MLCNERVALRLFGSPGCCHAIERPRIDAAVQLVDVHRIQAVLEFGVLGLEACDSLVVSSALIFVTLCKSLSKPRKNLLVEDEPVEELREVLLEHLLTNVRLWALPFVPRAVIVDVTALLDFPYHSTAAVAAANQAREREV